MAAGDIITTDKDVLVCPMWLYNTLHITQHPNRNAVLVPVIDPDGDPVLGVELLTDPDWEYLRGQSFNGKPLADWFTVKKYKYIESEI